MSGVNLICEKSFSEDDGEIVERFIDFQNALIEKDSDKLNDIIADECELKHLSGKSQSKTEFIQDIEEGNLIYTDFEVFEPTVLFDDENTASLIANVRITGELRGSMRRWISNAVVSFIKSDGKWCIGSWEN